jgi:hypothetical protein
MKIVIPFTDASGAKDRPAVVYAGPRARTATWNCS